jgi:hypothetical protein
MSTEPFVGFAQKILILHKNPKTTVEEMVDFLCRIVNFK